MVKLRIKEIIQAKGISQGKLSRGADVPPNLVRRMMNDPNYIPSLPTLLKVAHFLDVPVDALYEEVDPGSE